MGLGITSFGDRGYVAETVNRILGGRKSTNITAQSDDADVTQQEEIAEEKVFQQIKDELGFDLLKEKVFQQIKDELGFDPVRLYYKPFDMEMLVTRIRQLKEPVVKKGSLNTGVCFARQNEVNLEARVTNILHEIGVPAHIRGYHYMREAIILSIADMDVLNYITKSYTLLLLRNAILPQVELRELYDTPLRLLGTEVK